MIGGQLFSASGRIAVRNFLRPTPRTWVLLWSVYVLLLLAYFGYRSALRGALCFSS